MSWLRLLAVGLLVLLYVRSPIDLLPDRIGLPGILDDLLLLLGFFWWVRNRFGKSPGRKRTQGARQTSTGESTEDWDPYAVLGVSRGASQEQITQAYREQMKLYHPDRVAGLGKELEDLAHRKAVDIQRAYAEIGKA